LSSQTARNSQLDTFEGWCKVPNSYLKKCGKRADAVVPLNRPETINDRLNAKREV